MIYGKLIEEKLNKSIRESAHELLAFGLLLEKDIVYRDENIASNKWGKPYLKDYPDVKYSISHTDGYIACVISDNMPVGIDVERIRDFNEYAARRVCDDAERQYIYSSHNPNREFFKLWTLKESYIKAIGKGLSSPMKKANFILTKDERVKSNILGCRFALLEDEADYITAVCYLMNWRIRDHEQLYSI